MRLLLRVLTIAATPVALLAMAAGTALAGDYAEVVLPDEAEAPPVAGEHRDFTFTLLQHGVTPVDFGNVTLTAVNAETGETVAAAAAGQGGGRWTAGLLFPSAGEWSIRVTHDDLETPMPTTLAVASPSDAPAWLPPTAAIGLFGGMAAIVAAAMVVLHRRAAAPGSVSRPVPLEG